jgi:hypothetical protein
MRGRILVPLDKRANRMSKRGKLLYKQLITIWDIRLSNSVYCYDLWGAKLSALLNRVVFWVEAAALSPDVKIKALSTSKTTLRITQNTRCHILDRSAHTVRCYINNTHLLGCYALWRVTEHRLTFRRSQVLVPTIGSWWRHYRYHSLYCGWPESSSSLCRNLKPSTTWTSNSLWRYKLSLRKYKYYCLSQFLYSVSIYSYITVRR